MPLQGGFDLSSDVFANEHAFSGMAGEEAKSAVKRKTTMQCSPSLRMVEMIVVFWASLEDRRNQKKSKCTQTRTRPIFFPEYNPIQSGSRLLSKAASRARKQSHQAGSEQTEVDDL